MRRREKIRSRGHDEKKRNVWVSKNSERRQKQRRRHRRLLEMGLRERLEAVSTGAVHSLVPGSQATVQVSGAFESASNGALRQFVPGSRATMQELAFESASIAALRSLAAFILFSFRAPLLPIQICHLIACPRPVLRLITSLVGLAVLLCTRPAYVFHAFSIQTLLFPQQGYLPAPHAISAI